MKFNSTFLEERKNHCTVLRINIFADPRGRAVQGVGLWPLVCCNCELESGLVGHGCLFRECCVLSVRGLGVGLITCPEKSYRMWCV